MELDKFEPYDEEYDLEKRSVELIKQNKFWAAIVFDETASSYVGQLPPYIRYKIRMNTDKVIHLFHSLTNM